MRLGRNRINRLAACITGDHESGVFPYRRHVDLDEFFKGFPEVHWQDDQADSRNTRAARFLNACNRSEVGSNGAPKQLEQVLLSLLDLGEFDDRDTQQAAINEVNQVLDGYDLLVDARATGELEVVDTRRGRGQRLLDAELQTAFGDILHESDLRVARVHYANAQRLLTDGDFANAAKEAVCSVEAYLRALTGEADVKKALRKAASGGVPKPLDGVIEKLYAWRGNEPGVAHAGADPPSVTRADAQFAINLAAAINLYLREKLVQRDD